MVFMCYITSVMCEKMGYILMFEDIEAAILLKCSDFFVFFCKLRTLCPLSLKIEVIS